jgi:uncharacterized protein YlxW (UPF0749 family)
MTKLLLPLSLLISILLFFSPCEAYRFEIYDQYQKEKKEEARRKERVELKEDQRRHQREMLRKKQQHEKDMLRQKQQQK